MIYAVKLPSGDVVARSVATTEKEAIDKFFLLYALDRKFNPGAGKPEELLGLCGLSVVGVQVTETTGDA